MAVVGELVGEGFGVPEEVRELLEQAINDSIARHRASVLYVFIVPLLHSSKLTRKVLFVILISDLENYL